MTTYTITGRVFVSSVDELTDAQKNQRVSFVSREDLIRIETALGDSLEDIPSDYLRPYAEVSVFVDARAVLRHAPDDGVVVDGVSADDKTLLRSVFGTLDGLWIKRHGSIDGFVDYQ